MIKNITNKTIGSIVLLEDGKLIQKTIDGKIDKNKKDKIKSLRFARPSVETKFKINALIFFIIVNFPNF